MANVPVETREEMLACIPSLRAFATSLVGTRDRADDLVQETLMKAWANIGSFRTGTNMRAWLFVILRNAFYSSCRKTKREVPDPDGRHSDSLVQHPGQTGHLDFEDFRQALAQLPEDQREALVLIGASGFSYEEAAEICGCAIGTVKSRVNRARNRLAEILCVESAEEYGPDQSIQAAVSMSSVSTVKLSAME